MLNSEQIEQFYQEYGSEVLGYLTRRCPEGQAHDLLQETFLQVVRQAERLDTIAMPRAWLLGIARHVLARHYRDRRDPEKEAATSLTPTAPQEDARLPFVREAVAGLSTELRETLELRLEQELSYEEIASVLGIPIGTVRSRLHSAVRQLRAALNPEMKVL